VSEPIMTAGSGGIPGLDLDDLVAIDVHTHAEVSTSGESALSKELEEASSDYFKVAHEHRKPTLDEIGAHYRSLKMAAVVFTVDAEAATGTKAVPNEEIAESALRYPDAIIPFASIDPAKGKAGARQVRTLVEDAVRGLPGIRVEIKRLLVANALRPLPGHEKLVEAIRRHAQRAFGEDIPAVGVPLYADARLYGEHGVPIVMYGAGPRTLTESNAKQPDENLLLEDLRRATDVVASTVYDLLQK